MKKWIPLIILTFFIFSCKSKKALTDQEQNSDSLVVKNSDPNNPVDANENVGDRLSFYEKIYLHEKFDYLKITSKITADNIRVSPLDATIYIETDKKIWSNISFLIIPAARAIITPDGIKAMDRYNKNYIDSDFEYLNNLLNVNFFDYKNLEKLLIGRTFFTISGRNSKITKNMQGYQMESIQNLKFTTAGGEREYKLNLQYSEDYNLTDVKLKDVKSDDAVEIVYSNWETQPNNVKLPKNVKIIIKGSKNSQILLENTNFVFSRMDTPYSVPSSYKKIEIK